MVRYLLIGTCAAILAGGGAAWAQMPPGGPNGETPHGQMGSEGHMGMMEHGHWHHHMMRGTAFHFRKGDAEVDIACSQSEPVQACVTAAGSLLDKLGYANGAAKP